MLETSFRHLFALPKKYSKNIFSSFFSFLCCLGPWISALISFTFFLHPLLIPFSSPSINSLYSLFQSFAYLLVISALFCWFKMLVFSLPLLFPFLTFSSSFQACSQYLSYSNFFPLLLCMLINSFYYLPLFLLSFFSLSYSFFLSYFSLLYRFSFAYFLSWCHFIPPFFRFFLFA